jgi:hypothetical protein
VGIATSRCASGAGHGMGARDRGRPADPSDARRGRHPPDDFAPRQVSEPYVETRRPYRVELGDGHDILVALYDADLSAPSRSSRTRRRCRSFARRCRAAPGIRRAPDDEPPLVVIATDGEYGHHLPFRERPSVVQPLGDGATRATRSSRRGRAARARRPAVLDGPDRRADIVELSPRRAAPGADRACASDLELEAAAAAARATRRGHRHGHRDQVHRPPGPPDPWAVRDAYVDAFRSRGGDALPTDGCRRPLRKAVWFPAVSDVRDPPRAHGGAALAPGHVQQRRLVLGRPDAAGDRRSCARGAGDPMSTACRCRPEPAGRRPALSSSPGHRIDGAEIYARALAAVGQPGVEDWPDAEASGSGRPGTPAARIL